MPYLTALLCALLLFGGCAPKVKLFSDATDPLKEFTLRGEGNDKVLLLTLRGIITDQPQKGWLGSKPSPVQELVSQLRLAEKDKAVKAVVLKIDSPGGSTTASDIIYHELSRFKERTKAKIVVSMMNVAASGGYYAALPADRIMAHPTTITGSVGVVLLRPQVHGLMEKIGVQVDVSKSGENKDMGSPFRKPTKQETELLQAIIKDMADRFVTLVQKHRQLRPEALETIKTARIFTAKQAQELGLIDDIGYLDDGLALVKKMAGIGEDSQVIVYRRNEYPNDNQYNANSETQTRDPALIDIGTSSLLPPRAGFYYLWTPGLAE